MGINVAVKESTVSSATELVTCWRVVEACDDIPKRSDTFGAGLYQAGISAYLT